MAKPSLVPTTQLNMICLDMLWYFQITWSCPDHPAEHSATFVADKQCSMVSEYEPDLGQQVQKTFETKGVKYEWNIKKRGDTKIAKYKGYSHFEMARAVTAAGSVLSVLSKAVCWVSFARKTNCNEDFSFHYDRSPPPLPHHNGQTVWCERLLIGYMSFQSSRHLSGPSVAVSRTHRWPWSFHFYTFLHLQLLRSITTRFSIAW